MLDQSGSMVENNKWGAAVTAINDFVNDPRSVNMKVALQMFSFNLLGNTPGCAICDGSDCKVPMVPMGALPGAAAGVSTALNRAPIGIGTHRSRPSRRRRLLHRVPGANSDREMRRRLSPTAPDLVSDAPALSAIAGTAKTQQRADVHDRHGRRRSRLDAIAQASGTDCKPNDMGETCDASNNTEFLTALETIRTSVVVTRTETHTEVVSKPVQCEFKRPDPQDGEMFDKAKVNVTYTTGGQTTKVGKANSVSECAPTGGWYYDNEDTPTKILVCPATCTAIQSAPDVDVSVLLGCASEPLIR